jgi:hypothetical protein
MFYHKVKIKNLYTIKDADVEKSWIFKKYSQLNLTNVNVPFTLNTI